MEVMFGDGSISRGSAVVLDKWKRDFSSLLNCENTSDDSQIDTCSNISHSNSEAVDPVFNAHISVF